MIAMALVVVVLVALGSVLALAEASLSRVSRVRALALQVEGRRHAAALVEIETDPAPHFNAIYLAVMLAQNGSAILVALLATEAWGDAGVVVASVLFTLGYFVVVEALSKTVGILHSDAVALALAPFVLGLARLLWLPTKLLVGLAGLLLPRSDRESVSHEDIRSLADVGAEEGVLRATERAMIHSILKFGDTLVREVATPRPDITALPVGASLETAVDVFLKSGCSRIPVHAGHLDETLGFVHAKDVLRVARDPGTTTLRELLQPIRFVPESRPVAELFRDMQREHAHMAMVVDEFGSVSGLVTLEDLLEEIVGEIEDEHDREEPPVVEVGPGRWRVDAGLSVERMNDLVGATFPKAGWDTVGGLLMGTLGHPPTRGDAVELLGHRMSAERVKGRRVHTVLVERLAAEPGPVAPG
ncbi:MAG: hemolysin family protein [Planctomycetota bacterium]